MLILLDDDNGIVPVYVVNFNTQIINYKLYYNFY